MKAFRPLFFSSLIVFAANVALADIPASYYSSLTGKKDGELKTATCNLIRNFQKVSSYNALPSYFAKTDVYPGSSRWWDMYSDILLYAPSFSGLNREHSFPKSWWGGSTTVSAYVDLNHLYPSEARANQAKSNYPLGTVATPTFDNGITTVGYPVNGQGGGARLVFEPADEYKGDFARTYFYMVTCYQDLTWKYTYMVSQNLYPTLNQWSVNLLMKWHHDDPVSQKEMDRNEAVYKIQNNRNPFIDMPELADYLWGDKKGEPFKPGSITIPDTGAPELYAPVTNMTVDFGQVAEGKSVTSKVLVKGKYLKGTVDCQIYRDDADMFKAATASIPASLVCSEDGYWLNVVYTPTSLGQHTSRLLLSGDFGSIGVELRGECLAVPVLTACTATAPSDVMADRYTANWEAPAGEVIDYFVVTRTTYAGSKVNTEELLAEDTWLEILGFEDSDREAYSVQSVRLGYRSPMSNVIFIDHTGINGVTVEEPLVIQTFPGAIRFICSRPQTGCRIYNVSGMLVDTIDYVEQNTDHELPTGVYFITTDTHPTPVKVYVR